MKGTLLRIFSAVIVISLVITVVLTDQYAYRQSAENERKEANRLQHEQIAAIEAKKEKRIHDEQEKMLLRQLEEAQKQKETYLLSYINHGSALFTNKVDGYTLQIPVDLEVDMRFSNIRAVLENESLKLEIYRQEIEKSTGSNLESYVNYSNLFMKNEIDHHIRQKGAVKINGRTVSYLEWSRRALARVENDKCYYASVEVPLSEQEIITFLFKSGQEFKDKSYLDVVRTLKLVEKTAEPYVQKIHKTENSGWDEKTAKVYDQYFGDQRSLQWGIFETDAPVQFTELKNIEEKLDFTFPILLYYTGILEGREMHPFLSVALKNANLEGRLLELTLQTEEQSTGEGNMVYDILDGKYDLYLRNYAREVAHSGEPILFRLGNEMNGDWCVYSSHHTSKDTDIFKAFYLYVYQLFKEAGADNVIWVWNPNGRSFPDFKWNDELCYYPGDAYVDVIGMTSYNTGTYYESETWMEFDQMYDSLYEKYINLYEKPLMITEFSSSSVGGSKETWVANMFRSIDKYERIKVAIWWDGCDWDAEGNVARSYFIDETEELVRLFRENLARFK